MVGRLSHEETEQYLQAALQNSICLSRNEEGTLVKALMYFWEELSVLLHVLTFKSDRIPMSKAVTLKLKTVLRFATANLKVFTLEPLTLHVRDAGLQKVSRKATKNEKK